MFGAALSLPVVLSGCSRPTGIVGKWSGTDPNPDLNAKGQASVTYEFHDDGSAKQTLVLNNGDPKAAPTIATLMFLGAANIQITETYTIKDGVLTIIPKSIILLDDKNQPLPTPTVKQDPEISHYKISGSTLTLDLVGGKKPLVLTRQ